MDVGIRVYLAHAATDIVLDGRGDLVYVVLGGDGEGEVELLGRFDALLFVRVETFELVLGGGTRGFVHRVDK